MKGRKEAFGSSSAGSKSRAASQATAKSSAQQKSRAAANIESSQGGGFGSRKSTAKGGAQHK